MIIETPFINRHSELSFFQKKGLEIIHGKGDDLVLISPPGRGKTALLKELKEILFWKEEGVVPVYFNCSSEQGELLDFAEDYLTAVIGTILLFEKKELLTGPRSRSLSFSSLQMEAEKQGKDIIEEVILNHRQAVQVRDERKGLINALEAPKRIAQALNKPVWIFLDHFQRMEAYTLGGRGIVGLWREALSSPWAPHLFSGEPPGFMVKALLPALNPDGIPVMELLPLPVEEGKELVLVLSKLYDLKVAENLVKTWMNYLEGNPGMVHSLFREARLASIGLESHQRFTELYLHSLAQGELGRRFENLLYGDMVTNPARGRYLLKIMNYLVKLEDPMIPLSDLEKTITIPEGMVNPLIRSMERSGIIWERFGNIGLEKNRTLRDWINVLVRKYLYLQGMGQIISELGSEIERHLSGLSEEAKPVSSPGENILHFSLVLPINSESELVAVRALEQIATYSELDESSIEKAKIALIEACINAGEHSRSFEKKIRVYFTVKPRLIEIVVEDRGESFDPVEVQARIIREADPLSRKRGRGLGLIREMMDEVRFEKTEIGTRLYMVKKKSSEKV